MHFPPKNRTPAWLANQLLSRPLIGDGLGHSQNETPALSATCQRHCPASRFDPTRPFRLLALAAALAWLANRRLCWELLPVPWDLARPLLVTPSAPPFDESAPLGIHC